MKRLAQFLRSVIPADPWQLLFLVGVVFLHIFPSLSWRPVQASTSVLRDPFTLFQADQHAVLQWSQSLSFAAFIMIFATLVGYLTCFWPGSRPARRLLWGTVFPTLLTICFLLFTLSRLTVYPSSVFSSGSRFTLANAWLLSNVWNLPLGFYFTFLGLILVSIFTARIYLGLSSLPLALSHELPYDQEDSDSWPQFRLLIFFLVALLCLFGSLSGSVLSLLYFSYPHSVSYIGASGHEMISRSCVAVALFIIALWILGKPGRQAALNSVKLPEPRYALFALLLTVGIHGLPSMANYLVDRANWAAHYFGRTSPPQLSSYFNWLEIWDPWLLLLIFGAFVEELVFRGLLLRKLMDRYGFHRGIFLTGIVWTAIHFRSDQYWSLSPGGVLYNLAYRILICLAMNYVFAWMTMRWKSILPAAIAHAVSNMLVFGGLSSRIPYSGEIVLIAWTVIALLLFHYWPVEHVESAEAEPPTSPLEPAV